MAPKDEEELIKAVQDSAIYGAGLTMIAVDGIKHIPLSDVKKRPSYDKSKWFDTSAWATRRPTR